MTIFYEDDKKVKFIEENYITASNHSIIIARDRTIKPTKMSQLWVDIYGTTHS